jgi:uncharacterized protein YegL
MAARKPKPTGTNIIVVLDKSGSMFPLTSDTIGGFNTWLAEQQKAGPNQKLTLVQFATGVTNMCVEKPIEEVQPLTTTTYHADGPSTALLDAIGKTIKAVRDENKTDKVLFLIMTDGQENDSHEWTREGIKKLVEERQTDGWTFVYIGSDLAGFADAKSMGYSQTFVSSSLDSHLYGTVSNATVGYARTASRGMVLGVSQADIDNRDKTAKP